MKYKHRLTGVEYLKVGQYQDLDGTYRVELTRTDGLKLTRSQAQIEAMFDEVSDTPSEIELERIVIANQIQIQRIKLRRI